MNHFKHFVSRSFAVSLLLFAAVFAHAVSVTGTVTNNTTGKPSAGDDVVLVDVQAGMNEAATAKTDAKGQYSLQIPPGGNIGAYLIRVTHQGASYFIAAPQSGSGGDLTVYDVAPKVDGVAIDADMLLFEASAGELRISERYLVRNASNPPKAQFSEKTFEIALPADAQLDSASATRPGGLGTTTRLVPLPQKGHYTFNVPIQPDKGQKETLFEVQYHISYNGKYTFRPQLLMPADNFVVYTPKSMTFANASSAEFQNVQDDPRVTTNIAKNVRPGQAIAFTVSGEGQMPRNQQPGMSPQAMMGGGGQAESSASSGTPGGGIGNPIGTPDPLTKYKWYILGGLTLLLVFAAIYLLRGRSGSRDDEDSSFIPHSIPDPEPERPRFESEIRRPEPEIRPSEPESRPLPVSRSIAPISDYTPPPPRRAPEPVAAPPQYGPPAPANLPPAGSKAALLSILKEEMFAIESERLSGTLSQEEYADIKTGLEAVLKRALKKP